MKEFVNVAANMLKKKNKHLKNNDELINEL
jgi:hypothetical protein